MASELRRRNRVLVAVVAVILVSASAVVAGYIYASTYASSPVRSELSIVAEDHARQPFWPEMSLMILCPSKARQMGLCNIDERWLHAKYVLTVHPAPRGSVSVSCQVLLVMTELVSHRAMMHEEPLPTIDKTSDFTCSVTRLAPQDGEFELDLAFIGDADDEQLIRDYLLSVTIDYDAPLLSWMPLVTRNVRSDVGLGDLCLLGYHVGKHPPQGTVESENPLGKFRTCWGAMSWERQVLGIPLEPSCRFIASSYVTVHVVDANGKPIQNVTVVLYGSFCQYIDDGALRGNNLLAISDSHGNARFEVIPYVRYNVTIGDVVLSEITGPPPTVSTTITVITSLAEGEPPLLTPSDQRRFDFDRRGALPIRYPCRNT